MKVETPILRRIGPVPFWRGEEKCLDTLDRLYARAAERAAAVLHKKENGSSRVFLPQRRRNVEMDICGEDNRKLEEWYNA